MPVGSPGGPRVLLRRLREIMAEPKDTQTRLDMVVRAIAANMVAEVCSLYLLRANNLLELFATEGLNPEAVHNTHLRIGEGLVGLIAKNADYVSLPDAQAHPQFAYRPETGEEIFKSLMGVPMLRGGRVIGVLVVQNRTMRHYEEEEIESMQTVAMILAEAVASEAPPDARYDAQQGIPPGIGAVLAEARSHRFHGRGMAEGIAFGNVVLHEPRVAITHFIAADVKAERAALDAGLQALLKELDVMLSSDKIARAGEHRDVLEAYQMFARDHGWTERLHEAVESGLTAAAAAERVQMENRARMQRVSDSYLRERLQDLDDLSNRLLRHLTGQTRAPGSVQLPDNTIVVAHSLGPTALLDYDRSKLVGVVVEEGTDTSHVAIVARALEIPMVGGAADILDWVEPGDNIILDGELGAVYVRPTEDVIAAYTERMEVRARKQAQFDALRGIPAVTKDGVPIRLDINAGLIVDLPHLDDTGADGIGLFRTELQFLISALFPRFEVQRDLYGRVLDVAGDRRVIFRTLDVGADKTLPYLRQRGEENPALGWRGTRLAMERPSLLKYQVRALLAAAAGRALNLMFPMISEIGEFKQARALVDQELERQRRLGQTPPACLRIGTMVEVPSLVWQLPHLLPLVDFISIGSNDLLQFFYAYDRENPKFAGRYDPLGAPSLQLMQHIVRQCDAQGVPVGLCGELASRPLEAMALIGLGYRAFSMSPMSIGPVKLMVMNLPAAEVAGLMDEALAANRHDVRALLTDFATRNNIPY
ncbi:MAG: phosphoenolpyruvate--protein phosphotransferase [Alphaproteobacteria bacterium]|nr:phosphoenolpyruvate--protein phosphotransferase [Alphaproteobacteria bacterium]